jgi:hypothetical protein
MENNEIDNLVAQMIMGWEYEENRNGAGWKNERGFYSHRVNCWNPSTRIEQAWDVIEEIKKNFFIELYMDHEKYLVFIRESEMKKQSIAQSEHISAPMAICLAALKTKGIG